jgi:uncharacterized protein (TIGR02271 family)
VRRSEQQSRGGQPHDRLRTAPAHRNDQLNVERKAQLVVNQDQAQDLIGATAHDRAGDKIGKVGAVYYDDNTQEPKWLSVNTGLFGTGESFVPLQGAEVRDGDVVVGYDKAKVKDAPNVSADKHLSVEEEQELYRYYGLEYGGGEYATGYESGTTTGGGYETSGRHASGTTGEYATGTTGEYESGRTGEYATGTTGEYAAGGTGRTGEYETRGHDTSGPNTDDAMTRSEERLDVGTETREAGRARLRKHVVTERQQVEVPVSREEVHVEREPITDANRGPAHSGAAISEEEHEVVLREERPVVDKEAVPVERVRLGTETVRDTETVGDDVRREEIEVDDDSRYAGGRRDRD